jgi:DNA-binding transcriptional LysR family regulator
MKIQDIGIWEAFYHAANEGNFTRAAAKMGISLPLFSKRIARLEAELGTRLFQRSTRKMSLTSEGKGLLPQLAAALDDFKGLEARFDRKEEVAGLIRMTCQPGLAHAVFSKLLPEFHALHPEVRFELDVSNHVVDLIEQQFDLGIRIDEPADTELVYKRLAPNRLVMCASPAYLKRAKHALKKPADLAKHPFLDLNVHEWCRFKDAQLKLGDLTRDQWIHCEDGTFLTQLALQGGGIAVRALWDVQHLFARGTLVQVLPNFPLEDFGEIYAVIPSRRYLAPRIRVFIDFLAERFAEHVK